MASYRFPVLVLDHADGRASACLVEDHRNIAALADTKASAITQLKELLQWQYRQTPRKRKPYFTEAELSWIKVEVRPEYRTEDRIFPCRESVLLRLPCVRGKDSAGLLLCSIPTLGIRFHFDDQASLAQLVSHYVQLELKGLTPQQLARHLAPPAAELADIVIQVRADAAAQEPPPNLDPLPDIAEPIGARQGRGRLSRPWQRDEQVNQLIRVLQRERGSILLLGESGTGKTAILTEAVRKFERGDPLPLPNGSTPPPKLKPDEPETKVRNRCWLTSASRLISGMKYLGQWQERCEEVIAKLDEIGGILCVEHLLDLVRLGGSSAGDSIAAFLLPYLQRGELRLVGEATVAELDACRRLLPAFAAVFTVVEIPAFSHRQAVDAIDQLAGSWSQNLKVEYDRGAIEQICRLFARFMPYSSFPGRAASFTTELFDRATKSSAGKSPQKITAQTVVDRFVQLTGLPELFLRNDRLLKLQDVIDSFQAKVIGQNTACKTAAAVVTTFKAGMNDPGRPLGVLLFCGPTGVGKTELARTICEYLFGHGEKKDRMVRLDMSEYAGHGAVERLLGPPGGEPSEFIKRLREQPFSVVLLDEIEKASSDVFDLLLGVFDEGRLTDRFGRLTTFRSAIIVMTSNLGADAGEPFGLKAQRTSSYESEVAAFFRPEFFNRIDAIVPFNPLDLSSIRHLVIAELQKAAKREGLLQRNIQLEWSDEAVTAICKIGYDRRYGARPMQRTIEQMVITPIARLLVDNPALRKRRLLISVGISGEIVFDYHQDQM